MRFPKFFVVTVAALCIPTLGSVNAKSNNISRQVPVTSDFISSEFKWEGGLGGYEFLWGVFVNEGMIEICGVGYFTNIQSISQSKDSMRRAYNVYEGKKIMRDLRYFARVKRRAKLSTATANCRSTGVAAPKGRFNVQLGWDAGRARF